jgi:hypothetical protein
MPGMALYYNGKFRGKAAVSPVFYRLVRTAATFVEKRLDVGQLEPVIAPFTDAVGFEDAYFAPEPDGIGMHVEKVGHFVNVEHLLR